MLIAIRGQRDQLVLALATSPHEAKHLERDSLCQAGLRLPKAESFDDDQLGTEHCRVKGENRGGERFLERPTGKRRDAKNCPGLCTDIHRKHPPQLLVQRAACL